LYIRIVFFLALFVNYKEDKVKYDYYLGEESVVTREESIILADKLGAGYDEVENIQKELSANFAVLSTPEPKPKRHAAFRYFWPFLVAAFVLAEFIAGAGIIDSLRTNSGENIYKYLLVAFGEIAVVLIIGGIVASVVSGKKNDKIDRGINERYNRNLELKKRNEELQIQFASKKTMLSQYDNIVPPWYRDGSHMFRVKSMLETGKAETFEEAIGLLAKE
jgi:hypothetical protein